MNRRNFGAIFLLFLLSFLVVLDAGAISWQYNLEGALKTAKQKQMPIMIDFYTDWCGWCKKLDQETYSDLQVKELAERFIPVKIDGDKYPDLVSKYGVSGYPTIVFLNYEGALDGTVVGYREAANFVTIMNGILERTKKPTKAEKKPAGAVKKPAVVAKKPVEVAKKTEGPKTPPTPRAIDTSGFIYNGYIRDFNGDTTAQVNYMGKTYFVKKGDTFEGYKVIEIDTEKLVVENENGQLVLEFKKPVNIKK